MKKKIIIISGPTASGKSGLGLYLAKKVNGVIINADSMQIYKGLPILSAHPTKKEQKEVEHLLYAHLEPTQNCSVGIWLDLVKKAINETLTKEKTPIVVGGTGMYIAKLIDGILPIPEISKKTREETIDLFNDLGYKEFYEKVKVIDEESVSKLTPNDKQRLMRIWEIYQETGEKLSKLKQQPNKKLYEREQIFHINLNPPRDKLYEKCNKRFAQMLDTGGLLEVENFIKKYPEVIKNPKSYSISKTLGLEEIMKFLKKEMSMEDMLRISTQKTRNYAKRQYTWYRHQFKKKDLEIDEMVNRESVSGIIEKITKEIKKLISQH